MAVFCPCPKKNLPEDKLESYRLRGIMEIHRQHVLTVAFILIAMLMHISIKKRNKLSKGKNKCTV